MNEAQCGVCESRLIKEAQPTENVKKKTPRSILVSDFSFRRNQGDTCTLDELHRLIFIPLGRDLQSASLVGRFFLCPHGPDGRSADEQTRTQSDQLT
jgi:hypothetical protein